MKTSFFKFGKISWKLTIIYASIFSLILILLNASVLYGIRLFLINQALLKANDTSTVIVNSITGLNTEKMSPNDPELIGEALSDPTISIRIANAKGVVVNSSDNFDWTKIEFSLNKNSVKKIKTGDLHLIVENRRIISGNEVKAYLQIVVNVEKEYVFLKVLLILMVCSNLVGIVISLLAGYLISRRMLYPISKITKTAQSIGINNLDRRIEVSQNNDELSRLAETFNEMIDRLQMSFKRQNQFVSDASHELRTPISVIQGYIGLIDRWGKEDRSVLQESIDAIKSETSNMTELIEKLLFLARGDSQTQKFQKTEFSLNKLILEVIKESQLISETHTLQCKTNEEIPMFADRKMFKQMLRALIDNSIKFTPKDGIITVQAQKSMNYIEITIMDTGIGIPKEELDKIFNRFYRVDKARTKETGGSGLGLAIVKWIVEVHNGIISAQSTIGAGTSITARFPIPQNDF